MGSWVSALGSWVSALGFRLTPALILLLMLPGAAAAANARAEKVIDAARAGDATALRVLLRQRVDVNAPEPDGTTALHWAAHRGDLVAVDLLLRAGARVTANLFGVTPLWLAAENGHGAVVDRLLKSGADSNTRVKGGETVLMTAARAGRSDAVRALVEAGADVNAREATRGQTALMWAAAEGHADIVRYLVQHSADMKAVSHGPSSPADITEGASLYKRTTPRVDTFTPLQFAVRAGRIDAARELLDAGASAADRTPQGLDLLTLAIANAHYDMAAFLVERGADVNSTHAGASPLLQVVRMRTLMIGHFPHPPSKGNYTSLDIAKLLLAHGAHVDSRLKARFADPWSFGPHVGLEVTPFLMATKGADLAMMRLLAAHGADVTATNANGSTAVGVAAGMEMANPNEDSGTEAESADALKLALALGAGAIDAVNNAGETALHAAVFRATPVNIRILAEHGATLNLKSKRGTMPIDDALNGISGGSASKSIAKPESAKALHELMVAQGLPSPGTEIDKSRYNFGVQAK